MKTFHSYVLCSSMFLSIKLKTKYPNVVVCMFNILNTINLLKIVILVVILHTFACVSVRYISFLLHSTPRMRALHSHVSLCDIVVSPLSKFGFNNHNMNTNMLIQDTRPLK